MEFSSSAEKKKTLSDFFTPQRQQRLDLMLHLIPNTSQSILLRGPEQSGKSFFIRKLKEQADKNWKMCSIKSQTMLAYDDSMQAIADAFDEQEGNEKK